MRVFTSTILGLARLRIEILWEHAADTRLGMRLLLELPVDQITQNLDS